MSKFKDWTDEEVEQISEAFEVCYSEGIGPSARDMEKELIAEMEERDLDLPYWMDLQRKGEPIDDADV